MALVRDGYRCVICRCDVSGNGMARVDHIKPVRTHPHLALTLDNLRSLCPLHDSQGHRERRRGIGSPRDERFVISDCDDRGWPLDAAHHWRL